jgi:Lar family restriction alleviation protein
MSDLKPCPFCGCIDMVPHHHKDIDTFQILCTDCLSLGPHLDTEQEAIDAWNKRAGEEE